MLRLGIDLRMYRMAGIGRYLQNLLPELIPRLNASSISILGRPDDLEDARWRQDRRITVEHFAPRIFGLSEQLSPISGRYRNIDLLWTPQYNLPILYSKKLVVTIHDLCQIAHPETLGNDLQRRYARFLLSQAGKRASAILSVSKFTASEIQKYLHVEPDKIVVAYPPLGAESSQPVYPTKTVGRSYFLAVGNVKKHKNLPRLIAAFNSIRNLFRHDLVIVGTRDGFRNAETALNFESGESEGRIRFTGYITDDELKAFYRDAVALVFPSFYEGFGYPLMEAMEQGCPIVCSNTASLPEVAGDAALFFNPYSIEEISQTMLQIASDGMMRSALIQRGRERIHQFLGDRCARITAQTINRILECGTTAPATNERLNG